MKRILMIAAALASLAFASAPSPAQAATSVGISIRIGDPYPHYRGGYISYRSQPDYVVIPRTRVYYVRNYDRDMYRYGNRWYLVDDGYWFSARSQRGPFLRIDFRSVPRQVYSVPTRYRRSWGGSYANRNGRADWYRDNDNRGRDNRGRDWNRGRDRSDVRTGDFRDRNNNNVDDRDEVRRGRDRDRNDDRRDRDNDETWRDRTRDRSGN